MKKAECHIISMKNSSILFLTFSLLFSLCCFLCFSLVLLFFPSIFSRIVLSFRSPPPLSLFVDLSFFLLGFLNSLPSLVFFLLFSHDFFLMSICFLLPFIFPSPNLSIPTRFLHINTWLEKKEIPKNIVQCAGVLSWWSKQLSPLWKPLPTVPCSPFLLMPTLNRVRMPTSPSIVGSRIWPLPRPLCCPVWRPIISESFLNSRICVCERVCMCCVIRPWLTFGQKTR